MATVSQPAGHSGLAEPPAAALPRPTELEVAEREHELTRDRPSPRRGAVDAGTWIWKVPPYPVALWGEGSKVAAARGEATIIIGPVGAGKTTVMQRYVRARLGLDGGTLLGLRVSRAQGRIVYLAMDRPEQIARSFRRMVDLDDDEERRAFAEGLSAWRGPLPFAPPREDSGRLSKWLRAQFGEVEEVVIDSYKDLGWITSEDAQASHMNLAIQECLADGIEVTAAHHTRKANGDNKRPNTIEDVYGSRWLTAGAGSVICLWGDAGGDMGTVTHLKQPAEPIGPLVVQHDRPRGAIEALDLPTGVDVLGAVAMRRAEILHTVNHDGPKGVSELAELLDVSTTTIKRDAAALVKEGSLRPEGEGPARVYHFVPLP